MSDEEKKAIEVLNYIKNKAPFIFWYEDKPYNRKETINTILNLIEKQQKEIEELKREKETNQQMIHLAETQILGYGQGYKDGLNKETTATEIVARERENQIIYEGMKHKINMEWVFKIKAKMKEKEWSLENYDCTEADYKQSQAIGAWSVLQSLLEKE